jgi:putative component of membrane protein insertase Oxa1/YidC/SpoIIIJ protein YidD
MQLVRHHSLNFLLPFALLTGLCSILWPQTAGADASAVSPSFEERTAEVWSSPLGRMQKFISRADGDRCPMYPTCSRYAAQSIARHGVLAGWVLTCDRLLRCGRDETRQAPPIRVHGVRYAYDPLDANTFWWNER